MISYSICLSLFNIFHLTLFWTVVLEKILEESARRSNQFILKEISPGCFLEGLMLKLKLQYFGHLMQRADSLEKTLMLGGIRGRRRRGRPRMRWLDGITRLSDWTELNWLPSKLGHTLKVSFVRSKWDFKMNLCVCKVDKQQGFTV